MRGASYSLNLETSSRSFTESERLSSIISFVFVVEATISLVFSDISEIPAVASAMVVLMPLIATTMSLMDSERSMLDLEMVSMLLSKLERFV